MEKRLEDIDAHHATAAGANARKLPGTDPKPDRVDGHARHFSNFVQQQEVVGFHWVQIYSARLPVASRKCVRIGFPIVRS